VRTADLDYVLPPELVAHRPADARDGGRLLVVDGAALRDAHVVELDELIEPGSLLVVNDTRVVRARLLGRRESTGGRVEIFLLKRLDEGGADARAARYEVLGRASKALQSGATIAVDGGELRVTIRERVAGGSTLRVDVESTGSASVADAVERTGHVPLPPYVDREDEPLDAERYQTVFARRPGAVAAPTAGLHLSEALLGRLRARGVRIASCTLHVGLGTFQPVAVDDLDEHPMHAEEIEVGVELARAIDEARERGAPVVAVGTTVVRALESSADPTRPG
jgi:S-adenosylmethionine:tRNA ribosyltransferase-isomerase